MNFFNSVKLVSFFWLAQNLFNAQHTKKKAWCAHDKHQLGFEEILHG
jgi:hypothetical protein